MLGTQQTSVMQNRHLSPPPSQGGDELHQPLLLHSPLSRRSRIHSSLPRNAYVITHFRSTTHSHGQLEQHRQYDSEPSLITGEEEQEDNEYNHPDESIAQYGRDGIGMDDLLSFRRNGSAFAFTTQFWWKYIPISICMGSLLGLLVPSVLWTNDQVFHVWYRDVPTDQSFPPHMITLRSNRCWTWLAVTSGGGFLCGILILLFRRRRLPQFGSIPTFVTAVMNLRIPHSYDNLFVLGTSWLVLALGRPLGTSGRHLSGNVSAMVHGSCTTSPIAVTFSHCLFFFFFSFW